MELVRRLPLHLYVVGFKSLFGGLPTLYLKAGFRVNVDDVLGSAQ
jgi:hypothetical protein